MLSTGSSPSAPSTYPEISANAALVLITVACSLLDRQIAAQSSTLDFDYSTPCLRIYARMSRINHTLYTR
jgi:hypothetical protein